MTQLPIKPGIDGLPTNTIPTDPAAFIDWFKNSYLPRWAANADARNALPTSASVLISGDPGTPAGIGIGANSITNGELAQRAPLSVMGNATGVKANVQDIVASADGLALQRVGGALVFAPVVPSITVADSITGTGAPLSPLELVNDNAAPGNSQYYGTDGSGNKGFFPVSGASITTLTQSGGGSQNYAVPAGSKWLQIICIGGGGGGGSSQLAVAAGSSNGGGGGGGGGISIATLAAASISSPVTVTFSNPVGGIGGAPLAVTGGTAPPGVAGSNVSFGVFLIAYGGGSGATAAVAGAGGIGKEQNGTAGGAGGSATSGTVGGVQSGGTSLQAQNYACTGGGGGGGTNNAGPPVAFPGGAGGTTGSNPFLTLVGGTAGTVPGGQGGNGSNSVGSFPSSGGGGGGGSTTTTPGGNGGNGGNFGAGGGGGGSAKNTAPHSGGGGNGGPAACIIVAW